MLRKQDRYFGPSCNRRGFTLIELLVVIAVIGVLVSLMLPAIQMAREAARRMQCSNNLKQIGIALHTFHDVRKFFPPGAISSSTSSTARHTRTALGIPENVTHGWMVFLLPYVDQQSLYDRYHLDDDWRDAANQVVRQTQLSVTHCPSTVGGANRVDRFNSSAFGTVEGAVGDYGVDNAINPTLFSLHLIDKASQLAPDGVMLVDERDSLADITDGSSNTMWICEDAGRPQRWRAGKPDSGRATGGMWTDRDNAYLTHGYTHSGTTTPGPCAVNCTNDNEIYSFHPSGAMALFGDGGVHFLTTTMEIRVIGCLLTKSAGDIHHVSW